MTVRGMFRPGMRGYLVPLIAGVTLTLSAFLPWVIVGDEARRGIPDVWALWIAGLGVIAALLAALSRVGQRNTAEIARVIADLAGPKPKNPTALRLKMTDPADVTYNNPVVIADRGGK